MNQFNNQTGAPAQGAAAPEITVTVKDVEKRLLTDLPNALSCLEAIYRDPDLLSMCAKYIHGRYMNFKNSKVAADAAQN